MAGTFPPKPGPVVAALLSVSLCAVWAGKSTAAHSAASTPTMSRMYGSLPLSFIPNRGQLDRQVQYVTHINGSTVFLTHGAVVVRSRIPKQGARGSFTSTRDSGSILGLHFEGANLRGQFVPGARLPGTANYFLGNNPQRWRTDLPTYRSVLERNVYAGIDLNYGSVGARTSQLEYNWVVRPGANPGAIRLRIEGSSTRHIDRNGNLVIGQGRAAIIQTRPLIYQRSVAGRKTIPGQFELHGSIASFHIGPYDRHSPLIIDPTLSYSTYLGGSSSEQGLAIAADSKGDAYVAGSTTSDDFPTQKAVQTQNLGDDNVFVGKLNPSGTGVLYSTYIGGSQTDEALAIAVDRTGAAYVTGDTLSDDYPTVHALQNLNRSDCSTSLGRAPCPDVLVTKLSPKGDALLYSTYLGGDLGDQGYGIAVDHGGNAYVTGITDSTNFPTAHALQPHDRTATCASDAGRAAPCSDAFVAKINSQGSALIYSTYLGGSRNDEANGIAVDTRGDAFICGDTLSSDFPTAHAVQGKLAGSRDSFVAALDPSGSRLLYSTYLGGKQQDMAINIAVRSRSAYVTGFTWSSDFPVSSTAFIRRHRGLDGFVVKMRPDGQLGYSTLLGGSKDDSGFGIAVDTQNHAYVVGDTSSSDFPTKNSSQATFGGQTDAFVSELNSSGTGLVQSTYMGGSNLDFGHAIGLDPNGNVYVTGFTFSTNFPTVHALRGPSGDDDAFVARIGSRTTPLRTKHH